MAEDTNLYRYTSNKGASDTTAEIIVGVDEDGNQKSVKQGEVVSLTDAEATNARQRFNLTKLSDEQVEKLEGDKSDDDSSTSRKSRRDAQPADENAGGVVDPQGGSTGSGEGATVGDGQGTRGPSGQDVGTTTGGTR
jgi:hypothetical protein